MKVTDHNDQTMNRAHQLFSDIFLQQIQYNKIHTPSENISSLEKKISLITGSKTNQKILTNGHGPFIKLDDGSVYYDLYSPPLLGYSHPLSIKKKIWADLALDIENENTQRQVRQQIVELFHSQIKCVHLKFLATTSVVKKAINNYKIIEITQGTIKIPPECDNDQVIVKISNQILISESVLKIIKNKNLKVWVEETSSFGRGPNCSMVNCNFSEINENIYIYSFLSAMQSELSFIKEVFATSIKNQEVIPQLSFEQRAFTYLFKGQFYAEGGKVEKIQNLLESQLKTLNLISTFQVRGLQFSFSLARGEKYNSEKLLIEFFKRGLMLQVLKCPSNNLNIMGTLPLAITPKHVEEIFEIINKSLNAITK